MSNDEREVLSAQLDIFKTEMFSHIDTLKMQQQLRDEKQEERHAKFDEKLDLMQEQIKPLSEWYTDLKGAGKISKFVLSYLVIPASVVLGILATVKTLIHHQ